MTPPESLATFSLTSKNQKQTSMSHGYARGVKLIEPYGEFSGFTRQKVYGALTSLTSGAAHFNLIFAGSYNQQKRCLANNLSVYPNLPLHWHSTKEKLAGILPGGGLKSLPVCFLWRRARGCNQVRR
jgi:hypothetical protein